MIYRAIGLMSGSSLDGLDIAFVEFQEQGGQWSYEIVAADCYAYPEVWVTQLKEAIHLPAREYQLLHSAYGHYTGEQVNKFIEMHQLQYKVAVIASHGHTTFHIPEQKMTAQLGDGAAIAASTQLPVVSDLRALDVAFGGQGAPIVPIGEKWLLEGYDLFLNLGGIANLSVRPQPNFLRPSPSSGERASEIPNDINALEFSGSQKPPTPAGEGGLGAEVFIAFDICPANRVLNMLVNELGVAYDDGGQIAASGAVNHELLNQLNALDYYKSTPPKSLANDFGTDIVYPMIRDAGIDTKDSLSTYVEHIVIQIKKAVAGSLLRTPSFAQAWEGKPGSELPPPVSRLLATGGGALNTFLIDRLSRELKELQVELIVPDKKLVNFKEALVMAFIGVLRWRQEYTVLASATGAARDSIGGALWTGQEA